MMSEGIEKTCAGCWWQEGGRCYLEPCDRIDVNGWSISTKPAAKRCDGFESAASVYQKIGAAWGKATGGAGRVVIVTGERG